MFLQLTGLPLALDCNIEDVVEIYRDEVDIRE